jgi:hypothetical protein
MDWTVFEFVRNFPLPQGKFIRIHFGPSGKLAGADIETCEFCSELCNKIIGSYLFLRSFVDNVFICKVTTVGM